MVPSVPEGPWLPAALLEGRGDLFKVFLLVNKLYFSPAVRVLFLWAGAAGSIAVGTGQSMAQSSSSPSSSALCPPHPLQAPPHPQQFSLSLLRFIPHPQHLPPPGAAANPKTSHTGATVSPTSPTPHAVSRGGEVTPPPVSRDAHTYWSSSLCSVVHTGPAATWLLPSVLSCACGGLTPRGADGMSTTDRRMPGPCPIARWG